MIQLIVRLSGESDGSVSVSGQFADQTLNLRVSTESVQSVQKTAESFVRGLRTNPQELAQVGFELRDVFLKPIYAELLNLIQSGDGRLLIVSNQTECLRLPWELLPGPDGDFLVAGAHWTILRSGQTALLPPTAGSLTPPLRVLFCACAPTDLSAFDFEQEDEAIVRIGHQMGGMVHIDLIETGSFEEICQRVAELKPHIVHLSGHCVLKGRMGHFVFEDERGLSDVRSATVIAQKMLFEKGVRLLLVTGDPTSQSGAAALCDILTTTNQVPTAVAWATRMIDEWTVKFLSSLFKELGQGRTVESAFTNARGELFKNAADFSSLALPVAAAISLQQIYAAEDELSLVDPLRTTEPPARQGVRYELLDDNICGLRDGFVGRRRLLQRTRPALREGSKKVLLLTGISGSGKSTFAARLASFCQKDGFRIAAVQARRNEGPQFCLRLLTKLAATCREMGLQNNESILSDGQRPVVQRLRVAVDVLNQAKIVFVLDNLEELLPAPPAPPVWADATFGEFFRDMAGRLKGEGRVILTCSQVPEGFDLTQPNLAHEPAPAFTPADFLKYVRRHDEVANRMDRGDLDHKIVAAFHRKLSLTPRFVKQACAVLAKVPTAKLTEMIDGVSDGLGVEEQQTCFRDLFLPLLYDTLSIEFRLGLSRLALVEQPLPVDGVARVSGLSRGESEKATERWFGMGLVVQYGGENSVLLYAVHPLQRDVFMQPTRLPPEHAKAAHLAAAGYFQDCFELNREDELRVSVVVELLACLQHATACEENTLRHWAAVRLSRRLQGTSEFQAALNVIEPLLRNEGH